MWLSKLKSAEYLELLQKHEVLRIQFEALKLDLDIYKTKLKVSKKILPDTEDISSKVLLPE